MNLLAEHKVAKLIALVEELRRDLPMVRDRIDREADAMQEAVDPQAMLEALERASDIEPPKQHGSKCPSFAVSVQTRKRSRLSQGRSATLTDVVSKVSAELRAARTRDRSW